MTATLPVIAIIAAYNEEDIIGACLAHLHAQGVTSYLIDDGSTDRTVAVAEGFLGTGLLGIESLEPLDPPCFTLDRILARKEALAATLPGAWFINHDADEFRDSLWADEDLRAAIERVDGLGFNAIDFEVFTITPVGEVGRAVASPSDPSPWYTSAAPCDKTQVRAWRRQPVPVDLRSTAGHDVRFPGRLVFPLRFPMRHYPIRSQAHGERKLFAERLPRFTAAERERGWHIQYSRRVEGDTLVAPAGEVLPYSLASARVVGSLKNRDLEAALIQQDALERAVDVLDGQVQSRVAKIDRLHRQLDDLEARERARHDAERARQLDAATTREALEARDRDIARLHSDIHHLQRELRDVYASKSWRWMAPVRAVARLFGL